MTDSQPHSAAARRLAVIVSRILGLVMRRIERFTASARDEAERDMFRIATGLAALGMVVVFGLHAMIFAHALVVVGLVELGLAPFYVLAGICGGDLLLAILAVLTGRSLLRRPILVQSRARLAELRDLCRDVMA